MAVGPRLLVVAVMAQQWTLVVVVRLLVVVALCQLLPLVVVRRRPWVGAVRLR